jgi:hydroxymethylglutaryl-CoA reductase (NADPH)
MRAILRPLAHHSTRNPIETIVIYFVLATLAYFHVLSAIKHSTFYSPTVAGSSVLRSSYALLRDGEWVSVGEDVWREREERKIELQQVVFSLDALKGGKWGKAEVSVLSLRLSMRSKY